MDGHNLAAEQPCAKRNLALRKCDGGFLFIKAYEILWAYSAYSANQIRWYDLRVWFACKELTARRFQLKKGQCRQFSIEEVHRLVGGGGGEHIRASLTRLEKTALLSFREDSITFAISVDELRVEDLSGYWRMVEEFGQKNRTVPVPRRTVRLIASGLRKCVTATALGHVLRCCYYQKGEYSAEGSCSASWIARVFDLDERNIKTARKHLAQIGWLITLESDHWHKQRYGGRAIVNPHWSRPVGGKSNPLENIKRSPRTDFSTTKRSPPIDNNKLPSEHKNQKPAQRGPAPGFFKSEEPKEKKPQERLPEPTLRDVRIEDLRDNERLMVLFEEAKVSGWVEDCESDRFKFVCSAEHALVVGSKNPPGLFVRVVRDKLWYFTQDDEDSANRRLKMYLFGNPRETKPKVSVRPKKPELSADAKMVIAIKQVVLQHRFSGDPFHLLLGQYPDWTRERWDHAEAEHLAFRMAQSA